MDKQAAVASLGEVSLLQPARVRAALQANDRLKLVLTALQAAAAHASAPDQAAADLRQEIAAADLHGDDAAWLRELSGAGTWRDNVLQLPDTPRLAQRLADDLATMARPVTDAAPADVDTDPALAQRAAQWSGVLAALAHGAEGGDRSDEHDASGPALLDRAMLQRLTHGKRGSDDSLHLLVMDLHKALNHLAARLAGEEIDGAHTWQIGNDGGHDGATGDGDAGGHDRARISAFMRGVNRTRALKLDHPGLDTSATRDGVTLLIQNDIGTNDAHVLVLRVRGRQVQLTYSDLHRQRFMFFRTLLAECGAQWSAVQSRTTEGLNDGQAYHLGTATFDAADEAALLTTLEAIGARIVFLIDWNRARKRLLPFVGKEAAVAVLHAAAQREVGHMAWLQAGGDRLVWNAMAAQADGAFRLGDRLDDVLGDDAAQALLVDLLALANDAAQRHQPTAFVADEARLRVARALLGRGTGLDLLQEHAALCHALAQSVRDALAHGAQRDIRAAAQTAERAKAWERQADELVVQARARAQRQPQWQPFARLVERSDDVADALEEAAFVLSLVADVHREPWTTPVRNALQALADAVLEATQDHVRAVAIAVALGAQGDHSERHDEDDYLDALWRVLQAERRCDELLRSARRAIARDISQAAVLTLANDLAAALEAATDHLLALGYGLREQVLRRIGVAS